MNSIMLSGANFGTSIPHHETVMGNSTGPRDLGVHTEEVEDHPFVELVQYYCTVQKQKKKIIDTSEAHIVINTVNINYQMQSS